MAEVEVNATIATLLTESGLLQTLKRGTPTKVTQKWDARVAGVSRSVLNPMATTETQGEDVTEFLDSVAAYTDSRKQMAELDDAKDAGAWNYLERRQKAKELAELGSKAVQAALTSETIAARRNLCIRAGHTQTGETCSHCLPSA
ncbi:hypothetical protein K438DRAFT_1933287 [Mycena galopus ATCC 62051]|nr:hypothetical protein K438DRAFT_1933287 [Mycena galopus ATCC 62051]